LVAPPLAEIRIEGLHKSYGKVEVLNGVSFVVGDGKFTVLLGPSGCGKTTLLRCLAGLEKVEQGEIYIDGQLVNGLPPNERDLSMVFQGFSLFPIMSVRDNIGFPLKVRGATKQAVDERVREVAKLLSIEGLLDKSPKEISGGEQQRVAIGRAIAREPKAFLMDEPLSSLDAPLRAQLRSELKRLQKDIGVTTVYVTHDQGEALALADNIGVINKGSLLQYGPPQAILRAPVSAFVARFVGDPQANILNVSLGPGGAAGFAVQGEGFKIAIPSAIGDAVKEKATGTKQGPDSALQVSVRPEDIEISTTRPTNDAVEARVTLDEPLTLYRLVTVRMVNGNADKEGASVKALVDKHLSVDLGQQVWLKFDPAKFHFFTRETGDLLL